MREGASGSTVTLDSGDVVRIVLVTHSDGGYRWKATLGRSAHYKILSRTEVQPPRESGTVGGTTRTIYRLQARTPGSAAFRAVESRSFDASDRIGAFSLRLRVR